MLQKDSRNVRQGKRAAARLKLGIQVAVGLGLLLRGMGTVAFKTGGMEPRPAAKRGHEARCRERRVAAGESEKKMNSNAFLC